ncbi:MAG: MCP four helix bundle domain-containing protein, partial [Janthinobacterium lividum]
MPSTRTTPDTPARAGKLFADRSVRTKVLSALGALAIVAVGVSSSSLVALGRSAHQADILYHDNVTGLIALGRVHQEELKTRMLVAQHAAIPDAAGKAEIEQKIQASDTELDTWAAKFAATQTTDPRDWKVFTDNWTKWRQVRDSQLLPRSDAGDATGWTTVVNDVAQPIVSTVADALDAVEAAEGSEAAAAAATARSGADRARTVTLIALLVGLLLAGLLAMRVIRSIVGPLRAVSTSLEAVAAGDLTLGAEVDSTDELGRMAASLERARTSVRATVSAIARSSASLSAATTQLAASNDRIGGAASQTALVAQDATETASAVRTSVQTVATGTTEMQAAIRDIAS